jgi:beta-galactosidase
MTTPESGIKSKLHLGAAYYPEHWPEERWAEDIRLMKEAGFTVARMGEFAWSTFERTEGEFDFEWMDKAIALLAEAGIATVLGTPTAAPPAWLTQTYPDTLAVEESGLHAQHGNRCHYCVNSPQYHQLVQRIVSQLATHFGSNPNVIGWQIDNEYNRVCYCDTCQKVFQQYLAEKYQTLEALNEHWSTAYWSQTYSDWSQIPLPIGGHNPGLRLEFKRFITLSYRRFQKVQLDALRPQLPEGVWITHNFMGWYDGYDHYSMAEDLDMATWDWYIGTGHHDYTVTGAIHDLTRGFKRKNFWVMETQPGNVNWSTVNNMLNKGEARAMAWHAVAHGAEGILYWQWRSALGGQEQYHGSLVDQSGLPRPFYQEVQQIGKEFAKVSELLADSKPTARAAILFDYESRWSIHWQPHHEDFDYIEHLLAYYRPLSLQNIPVDIISADARLEGYSLVICPSLLLLNDQRIENLLGFVKKGGKLVLTARCGMKDEYNALLPARQPGPLSEIAGVEVEEYYALNEPIPITGNLFTGQAVLWAERLKTKAPYTTEIARYGPCNGWLDNQPAVTVRAVGGGLIYYVGTVLDERSQSILMDRIALMGTAKPVVTFPKGVRIPGLEVCKRVTSDKKEIYIMINHDPVEKKVPIPWPAKEHLTGSAGTGEFHIKPYGVAVMTQLPK